MKKKVVNRTEAGRVKRHYRIRAKISGTKEKPRLTIHRSNSNLYLQFVDDMSQSTLLSCSTNDKEFKSGNKRSGNIEGAKRLGTYAAQKAKAKGIEKVVFDRGGYLYHGRIKALADSAREAGLKF